MAIGIESFGKQPERLANSPKFQELNRDVTKTIGARLGKDAVEREGQERLMEGNAYLLPRMREIHKQFKPLIRESAPRLKGFEERLRAIHDGLKKEPPTRPSSNLAENYRYLYATKFTPSVPKKPGEVADKEVFAPWANLKQIDDDIAYIDLALKSAGVDTPIEGEESEKRTLRSQLQAIRDQLVAYRDKAPVLQQFWHDSQKTAREGIPARYNRDFGRFAFMAIGTLATLGGAVHMAVNRKFSVVGLLGPAMFIVAANPNIFAKKDVQTARKIIDFAEQTGKLWKENGLVGPDAERMAKYWMEHPSETKQAIAKMGKPTIKDGKASLDDKTMKEIFVLLRVPESLKPKVTKMINEHLNPPPGKYASALEILINATTSVKDENVKRGVLCHLKGQSNPDAPIFGKETTDALEGKRPVKKDEEKA